jgi:hypothetical protein
VLRRRIAPVLSSRSSAKSRFHLVAKLRRAIHNSAVPDSADSGARSRLFTAGAMVVVTLGNPREKFWGALQALDPAGLTACGIDVQCFDDAAAMLRAGDPFTPSSVFFPMHRVERIELDAPAGDIPSLRERFSSKSGRDPAELFASGEI